MKNFKEFDALIDSITKNKLPGNGSYRDFILFMNVKEKEETDKFLRNLGSSGVSLVKMPHTEAECESVIYGGFTFYIIETGYSDP